MVTTPGDGRRKYPVLASIRQRSTIDNTVSTDIAGGSVKVDTLARTFEIDLGTFRSTPGNEQAPRLMKDEAVAFLCKDQGHGQLFQAKRTGKAETVFGEHKIETFTVMPDGVGMCFTDHLGRLFQSAGPSEQEFQIGGDLKGVEIVGYSSGTESLVLIHRDETALRYCLYCESDESLQTLYEMPLEAYSSRSEALSPDGTKLYLEKANILLEIDLVDRGIKEKHLDQAGPWKMMDLELLAVLDERFLLMQDESRSKEVFLYDLDQTEYYLRDNDENVPKLEEIVLMDGESR